MAAAQSDDTTLELENTTTEATNEEGAEEAQTHVSEDKSDIENAEENPVPNGTSVNESGVEEGDEKNNAPPCDAQTESSDAATVPKTEDSLQKDATGNQTPSDIHKAEVWVSNIKSNVKAIQLRRLFATRGKVLNAKVVTNGTAYYGFILMQSDEIAEQCVQELNGSEVGGCTISLSRKRPESGRKPRWQQQQNNKQLSDADAVIVPSSDDAKNDKIQEETEKKDTAKPTEFNSSDIMSQLDLVSRKMNTYKQGSLRLKRDLDRWQKEAAHYKQCLMDEHHEYRKHAERASGLYKQLAQLRESWHQERSRLEREYEKLERDVVATREKNNMDREMLRKELDEIKKMRDFLEMRVHEANEASRMQNHSQGGMGGGGTGIGNTNYGMRYSPQHPTGQVAGFGRGSAGNMSGSGGGGASGNSGTWGQPGTPRPLTNPYAKTRGPPSGNQPLSSTSYPPRGVPPPPKIRRLGQPNDNDQNNLGSGGYQMDSWQIEPNYNPSFNSFEDNYLSGRGTGDNRSKNPIADHFDIHSFNL